MPVATTQTRTCVPIRVLWPLSVLVSHYCSRYRGRSLRKPFLEPYPDIRLSQSFPSKVIWVPNDLAPLVHDIAYSFRYQLYVDSSLRVQLSYMIDPQSLLIDLLHSLNDLMFSSVKAGKIYLEICNILLIDCNPDVDLYELTFDYLDSLHPSDLTMDQIIDLSKYPALIKSHIKFALQKLSARRANINSRTVDDDAPFYRG